MQSSSNLFIVGINMGVFEGRSMLKKGALEPIRYKDGGNTIRTVRGIYLRAGLSRGEKKKVLRDNALRIASYLHRKGASIFLSGPTALNQSEVNGAIHLASINAYGSKIIEGGFAVNYQRLDEAMGPDLPFMRPLIRKNWIEDEFGRLQVNSIPDELVLLYSFVSSIHFTEAARKAEGARKGRAGVAMDGTDPRSDDGREQEMGSRHRALLSMIDQKRLIERMKAEKGGVDEVKRSLERMASRLSNMRNALERAIEMVEANYRYSAYVAPDIELMARYGNIRLGEISEGNRLWRFENKASLPMMEFVRDPALVPPGDIPVFFETLLPERFRPVDGPERAIFYRMFLDGARYLNSITIQNVHSPEPIIDDRISAGASLASHVDENDVFNGRVLLEPGEVAGRRRNKDLLTLLCEAPYEKGHPFIPGMQEKAACHLDEQGVLRFAKGLPFTHIIKFPGAESFASKGANEWACMQMLAAAGVRVNAHALVDIPGAGVAYMAERFDIPRAGTETEARILCFEDFCALNNIGIHKKYRAIDLLDMARLIFTESSSRSEDLDQFFRQVVGSIFLGNFDGHARNFGLLSSLPASRTAMGAQGLREPLGSLEGLKIRLAPAFDVLSTVIYPFSTEVPLTMTGHRTYSKQAVLDFGRHFGLNEERTQRIMNQMGGAMLGRVKEILEAPPAMIAGHPVIVNAIDLIRCRVERVCHEFNVDLSTPPQDLARHDERGPLRDTTHRPRP